MAVAPLLAGWWLKQGAQIPAAPTGGGNYDTLSGSTPLVVEFMIDGLWVDVAALGFVLYRDRVNLKHGRSSEGQNTDSGSCDFTLHNIDGAPFSFGNPASAYWNKVSRGTRVRISVPDGNYKSFRFQGEIAELEEDSDLSGNDAWVNIRAAGLLDRLGRNDQALQSAFYREVTRPSGFGVAPRQMMPRGYWPMEEEEGANYCSPVIGSELMNFTGTPSLAAHSTFPCSGSIPNMSGSRFAAYVPTYTTTTTKVNASTVWWLMDAESTLTVGTLLIRVVTASHRWEIVYVSADNLRLRVIDYEGVIVYDSGSVSCDVTNKRRWFGLAMKDDTSNVTAVLETQAVNDTAFSTLIEAPIAINGASVLNVQLNPLEVVTDFYVGHVTVFQHKEGDEVDTGSAYVPAEGVLNAFVSERADTRFDRLCREEGITHEVINALTDHPLGGGQKVGVGQRMGIQGQGNLLSLLRQCEEADGGMIYEMRSDLGIGYRTLTSMCSQSAAAELSHGNHELSEQPRPRRDNTRIKNDVTVSRDQGGEYRVTDTVSPLSVNSFPAGVGHYPASLSLDLYTDAQTRMRAGWEVHLGTVNVPRFESLTVGLERSPFQGTALRGLLLGLRPGDRLDLVDLPARISYDDLPQLVFGFDETIDQFTHRISWNTVPELPYRIAILGTSGYDRLDAEDSRLAVDADASTTSLTVNSYDNSRWIDSATYASKFPFDIKVNGERMTVTAISGTSSTGQVFTVTRAVNGLSRPHATGSEVHINDIVYLGL